MENILALHIQTHECYKHMIAHAMEMVTKDYSSLHGEKIAVTTLTMANLQEKNLSIKIPTIKPTSLDVKRVTE